MHFVHDHMRGLSLRLDPTLEMRAERACPAVSAKG